MPVPVSTVKSEESGNTAGKVGRLPSLTHTSGRRTMLSVRSATSRAHVRSHSGSAPGFPSDSSRVCHSHTRCSVSCCWRCALVAKGLWTLWVATEPHAPRTGRIKKRTTPVEQMLARACREGGARVRYNAFLRDMNVGVRAADERRIGVLAQDLSCFGCSARH